MYIQELAWQHYQNLPHIYKLPLNEQIRLYNLYLMEVAEARMAYIHHEMANPLSLGGAVSQIQEQEEEPIPAGCIQFVVNTTEGTFFQFSARSNTNDFTYTITWGDGETEEGSSGEGYAGLEHTYPDADSDYTARICFSDASIIHDLDFPGFN